MSNTYEPNATVNKLIAGFREKYISFTDNAVSEFMNTLEKTVNDWIDKGMVDGKVYVQLEDDAKILARASKIETIINISVFDAETQVPFPTVAITALKSALLTDSKFKSVSPNLYKAVFRP